AKIWDIRGYYFLSSRPNLEGELAQWASLPEELKEQLKEWLLGMCGNASDETEASCNFSFDQFAANGDLFKYYKWYLRNSKKMYEANFKIESPRDDIYWDSEKNAFISLLRNDSRTDITDALKLNVERAWQGKDWHLELKFTPDAAVHINFQPGSTPYVMGDLINLDPTSPLTEKYTQVAFKHEYGHILGFPDCYVEFYDKKNQVMVIYTIDLTNIMCAQTGQVQQLHFDELRRVYSK
ncbi:MAG: hypothetical protein J7501_18370, partial [Bdellovibrio sp.]|nr:hypothetical protein [Bdellovibrio sp.]